MYIYSQENVNFNVNKFFFQDPSFCSANQSKVKIFSLPLTSKVLGKRQKIRTRKILCFHSTFD